MISDIHADLSRRRLVDSGDALTFGLSAAAGVLLIFVFEIGSVGLWLGLAAYGISVFAWVQIRRVRRDRRFRQYFREYLDRVILLLRIGRSFRRAMSEANESSPAWFRSGMHDALEVINYSKEKSEVGVLFIDEVVRELQVIERSSAKTLQMALAFRKKIQIEDEFSGRVAVVLRRYRIQAVAMVVIFIVLAVGSAWFHGFQKVLPFISWSLPPFVAGTILTLVDRRNLKWKV